MHLEDILVECTAQSCRERADRRGGRLHQVDWAMVRSVKEKSHRTKTLV